MSSWKLEGRVVQGARLRGACVAPVQGDVCSSCGALALRSFVTFEQLPLVRFQLAEGISDAEAARLLSEPLSFSYSFSR